MAYRGGLLKAVRAEPGIRLQHGLPQVGRDLFTGDLGVDQNRLFGRRSTFLFRDGGQIEV